MVFQQIAIRSLNSITDNIQHLFGNRNIIHGKVIAQVVRAYFATAGNLSGPQPTAVGADVLQLFALQQAVVVLISRKGIIFGINCRKLAAINPAGDIKMVCCIINPTVLQVACYRNLGQEYLQQRVSAFIVKLPGCFLIIKIIAVQLLGILAIFCQCTVCFNDIAIADSVTVYVGVAICFITIDIAYMACIAAYNICHIASACYRSSAVSIAQFATSSITANNTANIAVAADCTAISISIIIKLLAISVSFAGCGLGDCYYAIEYLVQRATVSTGNATNVAAQPCINHASVIACNQRTAVIAKQTADVFAGNWCNCTSLCIVGACLNSAIVINLILIIIVIRIAATGNNTMVDTNDATDICYTADITIYPVHQGRIADSRTKAIYADNTTGTVFLLATVSRRITMYLALIFHYDMGNFCTVFTDDAASTTSLSNNCTGVDNAYAFFGSTGNVHFIFTDNATDIVLADDKAFIAVTHAQQLAYLVAVLRVLADNAAYIGSLRSIHSGPVGRIGDNAHIFTGNAAKELSVSCNICAALQSISGLFINHIQVDIGIDIINFTAVFTGNAAYIVPAVDFTTVHQVHLVICGNFALVETGDTADIGNTGNGSLRGIFQVIEVGIFCIVAHHAADISAAGDCAGIASLVCSSMVLHTYQTTDILAACITNNLYSVGNVFKRCLLF